MITAHQQTHHHSLLWSFLLQNAFKCSVRSRDYCTTSKHIITMCLNVIKVAVELSNPLHVSNYVSKAESTPDLQVCVSRGAGVCVCMCVCERSRNNGLHVSNYVTKAESTPDLQVRVKGGEGRQK